LHIKLVAVVIFRVIIKNIAVIAATVAAAAAVSAPHFLRAGL
jgi:hypothetical protein